jgi:hypothetical protein
MEDLEIAKKRLREKKLSLSIVKDKKSIFETASHGISGFLKAIEKAGNTLENASVADTVAGKAVALLSVYSKINAIYAVTLSKKAKGVLETNNIHHEWGNLTENILNTEKSGACPFEKSVEKISNPAKAYQTLKELHNSLSRCG